MDVSSEMAAREASTILAFDDPGPGYSATMARAERLAAVLGWSVSAQVWSSPTEFVIVDGDGERTFSASEQLVDAPLNLPVVDRFVMIPGPGSLPAVHLALTADKVSDLVVVIDTWWPDALDEPDLAHYWSGTLERLAHSAATVVTSTAAQAISLEYRLGRAVTVVSPTVDRNAEVLPTAAGPLSLLFDGSTEDAGSALSMVALAAQCDDGTAEFRLRTSMSGREWFWLRGLRELPVVKTIEQSGGRSERFAAMGEADVLVWASPFDGPSARTMRHDLPQTLLDLWASGRPSLLIGPADQHGIELAAANDASVVVTTPELEHVVAALERLHDGQFREQLAVNAVRLAARYAAPTEIVSEWDGAAQPLKPVDVIVNRVVEVVAPVPPPVSAAAPSVAEPEPRVDESDDVSKPGEALAGAVVDQPVVVADAVAEEPVVDEPVAIGDPIVVDEPVDAAIPAETTHLRISLIMPLLNAEPYIGHALASLAEQGDVDMEIIAVDSGSTDGTRELLNENGYVRVIDAPGLSQTAALNLGFAEATGDVFGWLNGDDILAPWALPHVLRFFGANPEASFFYGDSLAINEKGRRFGLRSNVKAGQYGELVHGDFIVQPSAFWRREIHERYAPLDESLHYTFDYAFFLDIARENELHYEPIVLSLERLRGGAKTASGGTERSEEFVRVMSKHTGADIPMAFRPEVGSVHAINALKNLKGRRFGTAAELAKEAKRVGKPRAFTAAHTVASLAAGPDGTAQARLVSNFLRSRVKNQRTPVWPAPPQDGAR